MLAVEWAQCSMLAGLGLTVSLSGTLTTYINTRVMMPSWVLNVENKSINQPISFLNLCKILFLFT